MAEQKPPKPVEIFIGETDPNDPEVAAFFAKTFGQVADPLPRLAQLLAETVELLPDPLKRDPYWLSYTLLFYATPGLREAIPSHFDFRRRQIETDLYIGEILGYLSHGEQVLANLAFHLYNDRHPFPSLTDLRVLDRFGFELALLAIRLAHGHSPFAPWETEIRETPPEKGAPMP